MLELHRKFRQALVRVQYKRDSAFARGDSDAGRRWKEHYLPEPGERTADRVGYRSGYYSRGLVTRIGKLELHRRFADVLLFAPARLSGPASRTRHAPWAL